MARGLLIINENNHTMDFLVPIEAIDLVVNHSDLDPCKKVFGEIKLHSIFDFLYFFVYMVQIVEVYTQSMMDTKLKCLEDRSNLHLYNRLF